MKNSTYVIRKLLFLSLSLLLSSHIIKAQLVAKSLTAQNGNFIGFYEYKPTNYNTNTKYPIIIFLHGIGERGNGTTDLPNVLGNGTPRNIKDGHNMTFTWNGKTETFLVLIPQLSSSYGSWQNFYVEEMINYAKKNLSIDTNRIFLTGLSLGGGGTWKYAAASLTNAKKLAAIGVCCGTCENVDFSNIAKANLPTWAWHANDDGTVGAGCSSGSITAINNANPAVKPYLTLWPTGQHWIWGRVYNTDYAAQHPNIYEWFLGQDKSKPVNKRPIANAGSNTNITTGLGTVTLDASGSSDPDGKIVRYVWTVVSSPAYLTLPNGGVTTSPQLTVTGLNTAGTYVFELRVIDDRADWTTSTVTVTVSSGSAPANQRPTANAGNDITLTLPDNSTNLDGRGSKDPDGSITYYNWSYVSGPTQYTLTNSTSAVARASNLVPGTYTFRLTVTDNGGLTHSDDVKVTVYEPAPPPNQRPTANAGADITIELPTNSTRLDGSGSSDPDGDILSYSWSYVSGPTQYAFEDPNSVSTIISNLVEGTYVFKLVVTDNGGLTHEDQVQVTVKPDPNAPPPPNRPPVANAGNNIVITLPANSTTLDGTGSTDPDNNIVSYAWSYVSGPAQYTIADSTAATTELTDLEEGTYNFRLVVTDSEGLTGDDTIIVVVNPAPPPTNVPPVPIAGNDTSITLPVNSIVLDGSASYDPDGTLKAYEWTKLTGPAQFNIVNKNNAITTVNNLAQGTYTFKLRVWDNLWVPRDDTVKVTVYPQPNLPPVANAGNDITITLPTNSLTLNGTGSSDPNNNITSYKWSHISGPAQYSIANANAASTAVTNLTEGTYEFRLVVTDAGGLSDADTVKVTVKPAPNQKPVANAGNDVTITLPTSSTTLYGTASSDIDGNIVSYQWSQVDGPSNATIANATGSSTAVTKLKEGTYSFRLVVTDNGGLSDDDTVRVIVKPAPPPPPNQKPTANAGPNIAITEPASSTTLTGTGSTDADGTIVSYKWSMVSGPSEAVIADPSNVTTTVSGLVKGMYYFRLEVKDNGGLTDDDTVKVTVNAAPPPPNKPPVANAGSDIIVDLPDPYIMLNGSASSDPDGTIVAYSWVKVSGPGAITIINSNTARPNVVGVQAGEYVFELTVTDDKGATGKDRVKVTVRGGSNKPPVARAGRDTGIAVPASSAVLDGRESYDPDGVIVSYIWRQISGPSKSVLANMFGSVTVVNKLETGEYEFELTVTDNLGAIGRDTMKVLVVDNLRHEETLLLYPNPTPTETITIRLVSDTLGTTRITIYDMNGRGLKTFNTVKSQSYFEQPINIAPLQKGVYWMEINIENKKRLITKFIKR
jgi:hypothetical protein